jgi:hypothetical protein
MTAADIDALTIDGFPIEAVRAWTAVTTAAPKASIPVSYVTPHAQRTATTLATLDLVARSTMPQDGGGIACASGPIEVKSTKRAADRFVTVDMNHHDRDIDRLSIDVGTGRPVLQGDAERASFVRAVCAMTAAAIRAAMTDDPRHLHRHGEATMTPHRAKARTVGSAIASISEMDVEDVRAWFTGGTPWSKAVIGTDGGVRTIIAKGQGADVAEALGWAFIVEDWNESNTDDDPTFHIDVIPMSTPIHAVSTMEAMRILSKGLGA